MLVVLALAGLVACGGGDEPSVVEESEAKRDSAAELLRQAHEASLESSIVEDAYVETVHARIPSMTRAGALEIGRAICRMFDAGAEWVEVLAVLLDSELTSDNAGYLVGASTGALCPEHQGKSPMR
jgi:hypothetical protein